MAALSVPTRYRLSVSDFHRLGEAGIFREDARIELIDGELIEMAPIGGPHMGIVNRLTRLLVMAVGDSGVVSIQNPVALPPFSEPQPDLAVLRRGFDGASVPVPEPGDVLLVVEVADSSLAYDRKKLALYSRASIPEVWIVNVNAARVEVHLHPAQSRYSTAFERVPGEELVPSSLANVKISVSAIFA
jgi:Uma2 family endonuclease